MHNSDSNTSTMAMKIKHLIIHQSNFHGGYAFFRAILTYIVDKWATIAKISKIQHSFQGVMNDNDTPRLWNL